MRRPICAVCVLFSLVIAAFFAVRNPSEGQGLGGDEKNLRTAFDNDKRIRPLMLGDEQPKKDDMKSALIGARYYIWRATHPRTDPKKPTAVQDEFERQVNVMFEKNITTGLPRKNRDFINTQFGPALVEAMAEALSLNVEQNPGVAIQAAMMLKDMARLKQETICEYLLEIIDVTESAKPKKYIKGKQHDIVRLYALKAMKEVFPITPLTDVPGTVKAAQQMMMDVRNVEGLSAYITRPITTTGLTSEEVEAIRFLRREAIASLAQVGAPAVIALPKKAEKLGKDEAAIVGKPMIQGEGLAAPTLLKVLAGDLPTLRPSLQEKLEAVHGLCNMRYKDKSKGLIVDMPEYNPEVAIYLVGKTLQEFVTEYDRDYLSLKSKALPLIAWKSETRRLEASLAVLAEQHKQVGGKTATDLHLAAKPLLTSIGNHQQTDPGQRNALKTLNLRPANGDVFKTVKSAPIALGK